MTYTLERPAPKKTGKTVWTNPNAKITICSSKSLRKEIAVAKGKESTAAIAITTRKIKKM